MVRIEGNPEDKKNRPICGPRCIWPLVINWGRRPPGVSDGEEKLTKNLQTEGNLGGASLRGGVGENLTTEG